MQKEDAWRSLEVEQRALQAPQNTCHKCFGIGQTIVCFLAMAMAPAQADLGITCKGVLRGVRCLLKGISPAKARKIRWARILLDPIGYGEPTDHPLVKLSEVASHEPQWPARAPHVWASACKKAEKHGDVHPSQVKKVIAFLQAHPPRSVKGWQLYHAISPKIWPPAMIKTLRAFWAKTPMSLARQNVMAQTFRSLLSHDDHDKRLATVLFKGGADMPDTVRALVTMMPERDRPVWQAAADLFRKGRVDAPVFWQAYQTVSGRARTHPLMAMALVRYWIRASQGRKALETWRAYGLHQERLQKEGVHRYGAVFQEGVCFIERQLMRDLLQEGKRAEVQGRTKDAQQCYLAALRVRDTIPPVLADEYLWIRGLILYTGLQRYKEGLLCFLALTKTYNSAPALRDSYQRHLHNGKRWPARFAFQNEIRSRYDAKGLFWAGLCYEKMGNRTEARKVWEKASHYPFYFYGQMAAYKLETNLKLSFSKAVRDRGFQGPNQKHLAFLVSVWDELAPTLHPEAKAKAFQNLVADLMAAAQTHHDRRWVLDVATAWKMSTTRLAKTMSTDSRSIFPEAFPVRTLPRPTPDPALVHGIILAETCFDPAAVSSAGARGIMQVMPAKVPEIAMRAGVPASIDALSDPIYGMILGITELNWMLKTHASYVPAIAAYNAGDTAAKRWLAQTPLGLSPEDAWQWIEWIPYAETRAYVPRVLEHRNVYHVLIKGILTPQQMRTAICMKPQTLAAQAAAINTQSSNALGNQVGASRGVQVAVDEAASRLSNPLGMMPTKAQDLDARGAKLSQGKAVRIPLQKRNKGNAVPFPQSRRSRPVRMPLRMDPRATKRTRTLRKPSGVIKKKPLRKGGAHSRILP